MYFLLVTGEYISVFVMVFSLQHGLERAINFGVNALRPNSVEADLIACMVFSCLGEDIYYFKPLPKASIFNDLV
jgi:hypothetical protein